MLAYTHAFSFPGLPIRGRNRTAGVTTLQRCLTPTRRLRLPDRHVKLTACSDSPAPSTLQEWFQAARCSDVIRMTQLIRSGAVSTALIRDQRTGQTALHAAAAESDAATVRALFELGRGVGGARQDFGHRTNEALRLVNMADENGTTPLHVAVARSDDESVAVVQALLALGADVTAMDKKGATPGDVAKQMNRREVLDLLE